MFSSKDCEFRHSLFTVFLGFSFPWNWMPREMELGFLSQPVGLCWYGRLGVLLGAFWALWFGCLLGVFCVYVEQ